MSRSYLLTNESIWTGDPAQPWAALRGYTANGAYQLRLEQRTGTLTVGKAADLTVLGADLFRVDAHEIHAVPVVLTMIDGRITHDAR
ncbi:amidohydrolase family protein [Mycolicibacterium stellerae]|uniref:amidohydrolase family protein n=1 Tax=Mycolicibacterium stellerae TaxID=2358193 RepID=UPI000F0B894C|nr:amidohydrolase family protein [Mycolicibacterium stellerae]